MLGNLVTQDTVLWLNDGSTVIVEEPITDGDEGGGDGSQTEEPFLAVNDRTTYKTREEALRGYQEAQARITSLSGYEKVLKDLGAPEGADANYLRGVLTEYLRLATEAEEAKKKVTQQKPTASDEDKEFEGQDPQIVARTKQGRAWLKANAEKVGLISQEKYDQLAAKLEALEKGLTQKDVEANNAAKAEGQQKLTQWLGEAKVTLDQPERMKLENLIVSYVNSDETLTSRWINGDRAEKMSVIKEGYELFLPVVKPGAAPFVKAANTAAAGKARTGLIQRTRTLPQNSGDGGTRNQGQKQPEKIGSSSLRNKAYELMKRFEAEQSGAGE